MPTEAPLWVRLKLEDCGVELKIVAKGGPIRDALHIDLRWNNHENSKNQRDEQTEKTALHVFPSGRALQDEPGARARDEEEESHAPARHEKHPLLKDRARFGIFKVPPPLRHESHAGVEKEEQENGDDPKPVQVVPTLRL